MNRNLSTTQFASSSMSSNGAMPMDKKFDGDQAPRVPSQSGVMAVNESIKIPKPGFF